VTVRSVGVMEKCTFCIQRITAAKHIASNKKESVTDASLQTACQQACPAQAIVFGDKNNPKSQVVERNASPLNYAVLEELNVKPRVTYLAKIRNLHPTLVKASGSGDSHGGHSTEPHQEQQDHGEHG